MIRIDIPIGQDVRKYIIGKHHEAALADCAVIVHGALATGAVSVMDATSADHIVDLGGPQEIIGNGDIKDGNLHLHVSAGSLTGGTITGHFVDGTAGELCTAFLRPYTALA